MIRRATTPTHSFVLDIDPSLISKILITYSQNNSEVLSKREDEITLDENVAKVKFSQEDTNLFEAGVGIEIQVRVLTTGGDALASDIFKKSCRQVLNDEVLA